MVAMSKYRVLYERDPDGWWIARVRGVAGVHSNGRTIEEARRRVREALSLAVDDADEAELVDEVRLPADVRRALVRQQRARRRATAEQAKAVTAQRLAVTRLVRFGLSRRDAGHLLGLSHQAVQKLARAKA
jgi:predicted RNase H-like HicB family nuclease